MTCGKSSTMAAHTTSREQSHFHRGQSHAGSTWGQQKRRRDEGEEPLTLRDSVRHAFSVSGYRGLRLNGSHSRVVCAHTEHLSTSLDITARAFAPISHFIGYGYCKRHAAEFSCTIYSAAHH
jgi:hypothetical protein